MADVSISGLSDLYRELQELPAKIEANVMRGALRAGANVIKEEARRIVPVGQPRVRRTAGAAGGDVTLHRPGALRDSIRVSVRRQGGRILATIKAGSREAWYAHLVEFGTAAHFIKPKSRKSLFIAGVMKEVVHHPGARRNPFMRVALDSKSAAAMEAVAGYVRNRLPKEFKKLKR